MKINMVPFCFPSHHQQLVEEAFLPTLKTLLKAPSTSPLSDVNEFAVASYMLELVNAPFLLCHQRSQTNVTVSELFKHAELCIYRVSQ